LEDLSIEVSLRVRHAIGAEAVGEELQRARYMGPGKVDCCHEVGAGLIRTTVFEPQLAAMEGRVA
jgi:hypothetical protein